MQRRNWVVDSGPPCLLLVPGAQVVLELQVAVPAEEVGLAAGGLELLVAADPVVVQAALLLAVVPGEPVAVVAAVDSLPQLLLLA